MNCGGVKEEQTDKAVGDLGEKIIDQGVIDAIEKWIEKFQPNEGAKALSDVIVHTHAKDAVRGEDGSRAEVPLGEGQVPWECYIETLRDIGYDGFYTVEREVGDDPVADIIAAKRFLEQF